MMRFYQALLIAALGLASLASPTRADLQAEMNQFFDSLVNTTDPAIVETSRRGVIAGPSVRARNRIVDNNLVSFTPPAFEAGCGGVDLFAGSFSYVSGDQLVTLLKAVASNAAGYAFQIGLSALCETCMGAIESMQKKVQALNQHFGNSCQLAQGIVNDTLDAAGYHRHTEASLQATLAGASEDIFGAQSGDALGTAQEAVPDQVAQQITGNLVWRALIQQNAAERFAFGDIELLEVMMNLTGTMIVGEPVDTGRGTSAPLRTVPAKYQLLETVIEGGAIEIEGCGGETGADQCLDPVSRVIELDGFKARLRRVLLGDEQSVGLVTKIALNNADLTPEEEQILANLPEGAGGLLWRLSTISVPAAQSFAEQAAPFIALDWGEIVVRDLIETVATSITLLDSEHESQLRGLIEAARDNLFQEISKLQRRGGSLPELIRSYAAYLEVVPTTVYTSTADATVRP